jgi:hypothetical protein
MPFDWGHYATGCRESPTLEYMQKAATERWTISRDEEQTFPIKVYQILHHI